MTNGYLETIRRWRSRRLERVAGPEGWLSVVGLAWLDQGPNTVGSDGSNAVILPGGPDRLGVILVEGKRATFEATDGARVELLVDPWAEPTVVRSGSVSFFLIERHGTLAARIRDSASAARAAFRRLEYFPADPGWRVEATFHPYPDGRSLVLPTVLGGEEVYGVPGALELDLQGRRLRLDAYLEAGEPDLFVMFADLTNGVETYGGGRYLYAKPPGPDRMVIVDFNMSYNPPCVFTPHATCALPPPENRLPIRVEAGEKWR